MFVVRQALDAIFQGDIGSLSAVLFACSVGRGTLSMVLTACGWCLFVQGSMIPSQAESSPHPSTPMEPCMEPCASFQSSDSGASFNSAKGKGESDRAQSSPSKPKKKFIKSSTATRDLERESVKHKKGIGGRLIKLLAKCLESTCVDLLSGVVQDLVWPSLCSSTGFNGPQLKDLSSMALRLF